MIRDLINFFSNEAKDLVLIQTHNFPDHDAIASAYGLQILLKNFNINSKIVFNGYIQRESLKKMIKNLNIEVFDLSDINLNRKNKVIVIDCVPGNSNVNDLCGEVICTIDHHLIDTSPKVQFSDIRSNYGSCATIVYTYYNELKVDITREVATALELGISMDTASLTRRVSEFDLEAFSALYQKCDNFLVSSVLRNYMQTEDLKFYKYLIENLIIKDNFAFCYFENGCTQNLLGILGDFIIALEEIEFSVLCAKNNNTINVSVRSENRELDASEIIKSALSGIGFGGGHADMAGGIIKDVNKVNKEILFNRFYNYLLQKK